MGERLQEKAGAVQPARGTQVQFRLQAGHACVQMRPEDLPEERVQAVPGVFETLDERVLPVQRGQEGFGVAAQGQGVGQAGTEAVQDADAQQQVLGLLRPAFEHLGQEEVRDRTVVCLELLETAFRIPAPLSCQRGQTQSRGPAPGALHQGADGGLGETQSVQSQQRPGLGGGERQFGIVDLRHPARGPVAVQGKRWFAAGDEDETQPLSGVAQDELQLSSDLGLGQPVVRVEHEDHGAVARVQIRGEGGQRTRPDGTHGAVLPGTGGPCRAGSKGLEHVGPEGPWLAVVSLQGQPGDRFSQPGCPVGGRQGLAGPGCAVDQSQRRGEGVVKVCHEPLPPDEGGRPCGEREPSSQERLPRRAGARGGRIRDGCVFPGHVAHHCVRSRRAADRAGSPSSISALPPRCAVRRPATARLLARWSDAGAPVHSSTHHVRFRARDASASLFRRDSLPWQEGVVAGREPEGTEA